jgi:hypothetical protein
MKNLFEAGRADEVKGRIAKLTASSERRWGKMNPAQAMAHCAVSLETAVGGAREVRCDDALEAAQGVGGGEGGSDLAFALQRRRVCLRTLSGHD